MVPINNKNNNSDLLGRKRLKISIAETSSKYRLLLEGPLVGVGLRELRSLGARLRTELSRRTLVIDVKDAMLISQEGENVLLQLINGGAKVRPQSMLAKGVLQQLARRSNKQVGELIDSHLKSEEGWDTH
jgi:hypothetical protein